MRGIFKEPLVQFLIIGMAIFLASGYVTNYRTRDLSTVTINDADIGRIVLLYQLQNNQLPDKRMLDTLIEQHIDDEIKYREAIRMGLNDGDEIVRRRLIQKYDFVNHDLAIVKAPDDETLRAFYDTHAELFSDSATVSFTHIYFSADKHGADGATTRAREVLSDLQHNHVVIRSPGRGDRFALQYDYAEIDRTEALQLFGDSEMVAALFRNAKGTWFGPVQSGYGYHLVLITDSKPVSIRHYDLIRDDVKDAYITSVGKQQDRDKFTKLKNGYAVDRQYLRNP